MKTTEDLYELIRSLSRGEKMYFKKIASLHIRGKKSKYLLLFDAIAKQKKYDEEKLKERFRHEAFVRQLPVAKNYLYNQILKALRYYHHSIHTEVKALLHDTEILYEKGLYGQAEKVMKKVKEIAQKHEMHNILLEIYNRWEIFLAIQQSNPGKIRKILEEKTEALSQLNNSEIYHNLRFRITSYYDMYGPARNKKHLSALAKIARSPAMRSEANAKTFEARIRFYEAHLFLAEIKGQERITFRFAKKIAEHYQNHPAKIEENITGYIIRTGNFLVACHNTGNYSEMLNCIAEIERWVPGLKMPAQKANALFKLACNRLLYFGATGQFSLSLNALPAIIQSTERIKSFLSPHEKTNLFSLISISYFGAGQYHKSMAWLNRIRNEVDFSFRQDMESFFRLFYIIMHYEAGNIEILPSLIQSAYRFLKKKERLYQFEEFVIEFFRKVSGADTREKLLRAMQKLLSQIKPMGKDIYEKNAFKYFDYISWLESKIENRPFSEIVRRKTENNRYL